MTYLLNELSTFNNGERLTKTSFLPEPFFKHLSISFAASLEDSQVTFTSLIQPSLDKITGDKTKLQEVFLNLLRNAYESITSTGNINFSVTKADNNFLAIRITDDGCGMTHKQIDSMYTAFTTYKKNGSGLGLAIVKRVVDAHKGRIEVSSSLGVGSTFTVFLPIK
ncbi:MAG: ATP-binding protein [Lachnospiraceae bacterium]